jgi:hypothetical protein
MKPVLPAAFVVALAFIGFAVGPSACGTTSPNGPGDDGEGGGGTNYDESSLGGDGALNLGSSSGRGVNMPRSPSKCPNG